ncbi:MULTISPECIES: serine hydrolase [Clostridium]|uniref:D-alanyl-D-alanine carboxypeptidase n=1 Tax=Clostridium cibarium TaxID=2762247 RepID=A0ABR8PT44_9CLOT|nr:MULTISPECIES: serine hydrolase [Clostridium]MBD7911329.1 D-alanyl-D-alanine carboxypeptidase [Clostridium cibarium]
MTKRKLFKTITLALSIALLTPFANKVQAKEDGSSINIVSQAAIVMDYDTGEIIYEKNANEKKFLASTTKLMTSLLFAEHNKKTDTITYTESAKIQPPYTLDSEKMKPYGKSFKVGDTLSADIVMKGLLLFSGNDAAYMISDAVGGSKEGFAKMMNDRAKQLGLDNTHFENPNGLPEKSSDGKEHDVNYSTAYELALLTKAAYENDWVKETVQLHNADVILPGNTRVKLENRNTELGKNGNIGGKTGITDEAGTCFSGVYERNGKKYLAAVLKSDRNSDSKRFEDIDAIMDYSENANREVYKKSGEEVGTAELQYKMFKFFGPTKTITAPIVLKEDVMLYNNSINNNEAVINVNSEENDAWKVASEDSTKLTVSVKQFSTDVKGKVDVSTGSLIKANIIPYIALLAVVIIAIVLVLAIVKMIKNSGKKKRKSYKRRRY